MPSGGDLARLFVFSLLGVSMNQVLFLEGLERSTATNASLIIATIPVLTLGFATALGRERPSILGLTGVAVALLGALLLIVPRGVDLSGRTSSGNGLLLLSSTSYALYLVLTKPILSRHHPLTVVSWVFLFAALTVLPFGAADLARLTREGASEATWAAAGYVIILGTAMTYLLNNWALVRASASLVAVYIFLQPLIAGSLGRGFLGESLGSHTALAAILIVGGVYLSGRRRA